MFNNPLYWSRLIGCNTLKRKPKAQCLCKYLIWWYDQYFLIPRNILTAKYKSSEVRSVTRGDGNLWMISTCLHLPAHILLSPIFQQYKLAQYRVCYACPTPARRLKNNLFIQAKNIPTWQLHATYVGYTRGQAHIYLQIVPLFLCSVSLLPFQTVTITVNDYLGKCQ